MEYQPTPTLLSVVIFHKEFGPYWLLSSSDVVTVRGDREIVLRPFRPDHVIRPELRVEPATIVDPEPVQVRVRWLLADIGRGAHYAPHCDDVGHLPAHSGNYMYTMNMFLFTVTMNPLSSFELLFFAVFGQTTTENTRVHRPDSNMQPAWTNYLFKVVFGIYMLVSVVVLINLLIAMMSDTYQRIQVKSVHGRQHLLRCTLSALATTRL
jgi:hypothetical protein